MSAHDGRSLKAVKKRHKNALHRVELLANHMQGAAIAYALAFRELDEAADALKHAKGRSRTRGWLG